ncbi:DUF6185 family protein [Streptomyces sp. MS1.AVA.1]|uniref:DUF6185 family protein n=1 Tax=Streptomyces machairae TaxID=3134109 RepID=A0ABU8UVN4_9ACTN
MAGHLYGPARHARNGAPGPLLGFHMGRCGLRPRGSVADSPRAAWAIKALPVAVAFALPMALDALFGWFTQEGAANLALYASTMLLVLTVTGIALDLDTFRTERRFWQSRLGLLLSVYQMRYYSLQVAYLIGQVIALITIWKFFAEPSATPPDGDK